MDVSLVANALNWRERERDKLLQIYGIKLRKISVGGSISLGIKINGK